MRIHHRLLVCGLAAAGLGSLGAVSGAPGDAITDPAAAGPSFRVQGEYSGTSPEGNKIGAQVIDMGKNTYRAVFYPGGLPGDGWSKPTRHQLDGKGEGETASFTSADGAYEVTVAGGKMKIKHGDQSVELPRVERRSSTLGQKPPAGAVVLFDGTSAAAWQGGRLAEGNLLAVGTRSMQAFRDFQAHLEFRLPYMPEARGQGRGNSGVYVQDRYEIQVLDSFGLTGEDNECGGIYKESKPSENMCYPPLAWQTYDIDFTAAKFDAAGTKTAPAVITVRHNGVVIHDKIMLKNVTPGGGLNKESADPGPFSLQNHGNPVVFRNIWVAERK